MTKVILVATPASDKTPPEVHPGTVCRVLMERKLSQYPGLKEFCQKETEAMLYACNVYVVCRSGLLRKPAPIRSTKGVLSRKKWKLCYKHITYMLYVGQDSFRTHVLTGFLKDFCPERNGSYVRKVYAVCRTALFQNPCPNTSIDMFICRTGLLRRPCLDRTFEGVLSKKKCKLCYIYSVQK